MKSVQIEKFGFEHLSIKDILTPTPKAGEVLVKVTAASLNYIDLDVIRGNYDPNLPLPHVPVSDAAGVVEAVGEGVSQWRKGDRITTHFFRNWFSGQRTELMFKQRQGLEYPGVLEEFILIPAASLMRTPSNLTDEEAATLPIAGLTAWSGLVDFAGVKKGQTILVQGTGGVSIFALQIAKLWGIKTIALSSSAAKLEKLKALGADEVINYKTTPDWPAEVKRLGGADATLNIAGGETVGQSLQALNLHGFIGLVGYLDNNNINFTFSDAILKDVRIQPIAVGNLESYQRFGQFIEQHKLSPVIDSVYPVEKIQEAVTYMESGAHFGKIIIKL